MTEKKDIQVNHRFPTSLAEELKRVAREQDTSQSQLVREAVELKLAILKASSEKELVGVK